MENGVTGTHGNISPSRLSACCDQHHWLPCSTAAGLELQLSDSICGGEFSCAGM